MPTIFQPRIIMTSEEIRDGIEQGKRFTVEMKDRQSVYRIAETLGVQAKCRKVGVNCYEVIIIGIPQRAAQKPQNEDHPTTTQAQLPITQIGDYLLWPPSLREEVGELRRWRPLGESFDDFPFLRGVLDATLLIGHNGLKYAAYPDGAYHPHLFIPTATNDWREWRVIDESGIRVGGHADILEIGLLLLKACGEADMETQEVFDYITSQEEYDKVIRPNQKRRDVQMSMSNEKPNYTEKNNEPSR